MTIGVPTHSWLKLQSYIIRATEATCTSLVHTTGTGPSCALLHVTGTTSCSDASLIRATLAFGSGASSAAGRLRFRPRLLPVIASSTLPAAFLASFSALLASLIALLTASLAFFVSFAVSFAARSAFAFTRSL
ncbi:hypothetical protein AOQ84DRAFT_180203 [Glonium stellatum]|uniref:Uncharacterized protein n=1 Tax=Glonium stellatum TaxID=574774 RepID=A0A8E2JMD1_9PEZI|nr:hypothetical protein AOQ84DRAFT_180203 [Glonium stellatum]